MGTFRFVIDNEEELKDSIVRITSEQLNYVKGLTLIRKNIELSVHEIRKACKRLRALLRLIRYDIGEELFVQENTKYRDWAKSLSLLRDYNVIIAYLAGLFEADEIPISESNFIRFINHLNEQKEEEMKVVVEGGVFKAINKRCKEQLEIISSYTNVDFGPHTIHTGVINTYRGCLDTMEAAQRNLDDVTLHELRKRVKYLYNQMLLMQAVWPEYFIHYSSSLKSASELLGDDHNLVETITIIGETPSEILDETDKNSLIQCIENERRHIHGEVWPLMGKVFTESSEAFAGRVKSYWLISRE